MNNQPKKKGGKRPGSGRKKGVPNKRSKAALIAEACKQSGKRLPLEFLLEMMNEPEPKQRANESQTAFLARMLKWRDERLDAAKAAAPYCHPKLAQVEHSGTGEGGSIVHRHIIEFV